MRQWRVGTISMGILLIVLGAVMLFAQIRGLSAISQIIKWWPSILIVLGIEILIYIFLSKEDQPKVKFDVFSIFIIGVIMFFSLGAYALTNVKGYFNGVEFSSIFNHYQYESSFKKNLTLVPQNTDKLFVSNSFGNVQIQKGSGNQIEVEANITMRNNDEDYAKSVADSLIDLEENDRVELKSKTSQYLDNKSKIESVRVSYFIKVPEKMAVEVENKFGNIELNNLSLPAKLVNTNGNIRVKALGGDLDLQNSFGKVEVDGVKGKVKVKDKNGSVELKNIQSECTVENAFGEVKVYTAKGNVTVDNNNSNITVENVEGNLIVNSKFCKVETKDIKGNIELEGSNGGITSRNIGGDVKVTNKFGDVNLINANKSIDISNGNGKIDVKCDKLVEKDLNIKNSFGSINIKLTKDQQGRFNADTKFGNIKSEFNLNINKETNAQSIDQTIGDGKIKFFIENRNGDIGIEAF